MTFYKGSVVFSEFFILDQMQFHEVRFYAIHNELYHAVDPKNHKLFCFVYLDFSVCFIAKQPTRVACS
uniref:Uncharacterized protein n=1 Tax=Erpetoichthys calabaricus TaxID=27687 RepID=A0A8C4SSI2_ERPCA